MTYSSVALLVDGDNISAKYAGQIIEKASEFGHIKFRKVFGRDNSLKNWSDDKSYTRIEVEPLKNAADFQLSFDAVEMAATGKVDSFVIVSSDKDLAHVASRLKKQNIPVLGLGEPKTPGTFKSACKTFQSLHCVETTAKAKELALAVFRSKGLNSKGILLNRFGGFARSIESNFSIKATSFGSWTKVFEKHSDCFSITGEKKNKRVHCKRDCIT